MTYLHARIAALMLIGGAQHLNTLCPMYSDGPRVVQSE